jgi:hypothetical protein
MAWPVEKVSLGVALGSTRAMGRRINVSQRRGNDVNGYTYSFQFLIMPVLDTGIFWADRR